MGQWRIKRIGYPNKRICWKCHFWKEIWLGLLWWKFDCSALYWKCWMDHHKGNKQNVREST